MLSDSQLLEKANRIQCEYGIFADSGYTLSDIEIAELVVKEGIKTSSSTVGRDLTCEMFKEMIGETEFNIIQEKRKENKLKGKVKGGIVSTTVNEAIRDNEGHFVGNRKK